MDHKGLLTCANYAFPPNSLHYCGPEKQADLAGYQQEQTTDAGLVEIIRDFQTLYPYLRLIAHENNIADPFDPRVVDAYWIGNGLLRNIKIDHFYYHLHNSLGLQKKVKLRDLEYLYGKLPQGLLPHHTFHVLNVFSRTGHQAIEHTLETMDACRIGWGKVVTNPKLLVETQPLILKAGKLVLGKPIIKKIDVPIQLEAKSQTLPAGRQGPTANDIISFHWNTFCDILSDGQVKSLERYTRQAIRLANTTL